MRKILFTLSFAIMLFSSCEEVSVDGGWDPIEFDHNEFTVSSNGGTVYSKILNYSGIWLNYITVTKEGLADSEPEIFHPIQTYDSLSCKYAELSISKDKNPVVKIEVSPNNEQKALLMKIAIEAGDAFSSITIHQDPAK